MTAPFGAPLVGNDWSAALVDPPAPRRVSVVVAHFDQQAQLERTLAALARQTHPADLLEVVVADDGSPEPPRVPDGVRLVRQEDRGFRLSAVRNLGARAATGDVLCFLDADTAPEPAYVARLAAIPSALPDVVAVGRRRHAELDRAGPAEPVEAAGPRLELPEPAWLADAYRGSRDLLDADARSYRFAIGAVLACSRWLLDDVGGFDESFDAYGGEDWEWAHRAWLGGAGLAHVPGAVAWHDGPDWAGRDEAERVERKNAETARLWAAIGAPGGMGGSLLGAAADVVVRLERAATPAAGAVCVDAVLRAMPTARVVAPDHVRAALPPDPRVVAAWPGPARVVLALRSPVALSAAGAAAVAEAVGAVGVGDLGVVRLGDAATATAVRATARDRRWGGPTGWRTEQRGDAGLVAVPDAADLEAYLGGWWPGG
ncbi:glycosyltransferase family 2 protein [Agrococcus terreus]|uniref:glycosyltransferase family 2 protein n=1 Tax=Agrococcus terreus TaxID=574649 RepID=UPI0031E395C7